MNDELSAADGLAGGRPSAPREWGPAHTREISWHLPSISPEQARTTSGLDYLNAIIAGRLPPPPIAAVATIEVIGAEHGVVDLRCVPDESWLNPNRSVHGGLLCTLMDSAMGMSVLSTRDSLLEPYTSIELKISFIKPLPWDGQHVDVRGTVLRVGRKVAFAEAHARTADGTLVGHGTSSLAAVAPL